MSKEFLLGGGDVRAFTNADALVDYLDNNGGCMLVKAGCGQGKTHMAIEICKKLKNHRIFSIVSRRTLNKDHMKKFATVNEIKDYKDEYGYSNDYGFITQVDSLLKHFYLRDGKLYSKNLNFQNERQYDNVVNTDDLFLYLDEIRSMIYHTWESKTYVENNRLEIIGIIKYLIRNCKYVIGTDADLNKTVIDLFDDAGRNFKYIVNEYKSYNGIVAKHIKSQEQMIEKIKTYESSLVCSDEKRLCKKIAKEVEYYFYVEKYGTDKGFDENKVLTGNGEFVNLIVADKNSEDIDIELDADKDYKEGREHNFRKIVVFSPTILYGIDSQDVRPTFCLFTTATALSTYDHIQMISRNRHPTILYYTFRTIKFSLPYYNSFEDAENDNKLIEKLSLEMFEKYSTNNNTAHIFKTKREDIDTYNKIKSTNSYINDCYKTNLFLHFRDALKDKGFLVEPLKEISFEKGHITRDVIKVDTDIQTIKDAIKKHKDYYEDNGKRPLISIDNNNLNELIEEIPSSQIYIAELFGKNKLNELWNIKRLFYMKEQSLIDNIDSRNDAPVNKTQNPLMQIYLFRRFLKLLGMSVYTNQMKINNLLTKTQSNTIVGEYGKTFADRTLKVDLTTRKGAEVLIKKMVQKLKLKDVILNTRRQYVTEDKKQRDYYEFSLDINRVNTNSYLLNNMNHDAYQQYNLNTDEFIEYED